MQDMGAQIFELAYATHEDAHVELRFGASTISRALCSGLDVERGFSEQGLFDGSVGTVRYLVADEISGMVKGAVIEIKTAHMADFEKVRIQARRAIGGLVTCKVVARFD